MLTEADWKAIEVVMKWLKSFRSATIQMSHFGHINFKRALYSLIFCENSLDRVVVVLHVAAEGKMVG